MPSSKTQSPELIRIAQVAEKIGVSKPTIRRWVAAGFFPEGKKLGPRAVYWSVADIDAFLASLSKK